MPDLRCPRCNEQLTEAEAYSLAGAARRAKRTDRRGAPRKLSPQQLGAARRMLRAGKSQAEVARHFGISQPTVSTIANSDPYDDE